MIFVTVGTHEQAFDRLVQFIDEMKRDGEINEEVVIQTGFCTYEPQYCTWQKLYSYKEMKQFVEEASIVITHGGPSSFIMPLQIGKTPIVVPRKKEYDEHVNDHQVDFAKAVAKRMGTIILAEDMVQLKNAIMNYDLLVASKPMEMQSNNESFNNALENIVSKMFKEKKGYQEHEKSWNIINAKNI